METLQIIWFILWGVLWSVYFMLDGFVLGTGMLYLNLGKTDTERRMLIHSVGPVWNGNEVWLITAGGATFAAFPTTYALMFSYLYAALLLLLFALIIRGVAFELREKTAPSFKPVWDGAISLSGLIVTLLLGVAFGNIFAGLPMDAEGYHGSLITLLNPYGLITGVLFVLLFATHGALYIASKTTSNLADRARQKAVMLWPVLLLVAVVFLISTAFATHLYDNYLRSWPLLILPIIAVAALFGIRFFLTQDKPIRAFAASCLTILGVAGTGIAGLFPNLIPSSLDPAYSLTIFNSSSSRLTLTVMTIVALILVPIVIAYKIWVYRIFRGCVTEKDVAEDGGSY